MGQYLVVGQFEIQKSEAPPKQGRFGLVVVFISVVLRIALDERSRHLVFSFLVVGYFIARDGYRPATRIPRVVIIEAHL